MRNSADSYIIQAADTVAYFLKQANDPSNYLRQKGGHNYFSRLEPVLCKAASPRDPFGVVRF